MPLLSIESASASKLHKNIIYFFLCLRSYLNYAYRMKPATQAPRIEQGVSWFLFIFG